MTHVDTSTAARRQTRTSSPATLSELYISLHKKYARESREQLRDRFIQVASELPAMIDEGLGFWEAMHHKKLVEPAPLRKTATPQERQERKQEARAATDAIVERGKAAALKIALLDLKMPNDKPLRDCKFIEVAQFGLAFARISSRGKPNELVGKVLNEEQVRALWDHK